MKIQELYEKYLLCTGISIDTRSIKPGDLFVAIKGDNFDGNKYAQKAIDAGANFALVDDQSLEDDSQIILVKDSLKTLQELANYHRKQFTGSILAITGSNGKTTTKELVFHALKSHYKVACTQGNFNNHLGVPLTLLSMQADVEIAIVEMGANHLGEIADLCKIAEPTHGVITNIGTAHIGEFGGKENIIRAKSELFDYLLKNDGHAFINKEDLVLSNMSKRFTNKTDYPNNLCEFQGSSPFVKYKNQSNAFFETKLVGAYNFQNIAASITIANFFKVPETKIHNAISSYTPENNRSQILKLGSNTIILDAYNANPDSVKVALDNLSEFDSENKIAILGDMKELGSYSQKKHQNMVSYAKNINLTAAYYVGEEYIKVNPESFPELEKLKTFLIQNPLSNAVVLLKGSRSMALEQLTTIAEIWQ